MFQAPAEAELEVLGSLPFFEHKQCAAVGVGLRYKSFLTQGRELVAIDLSADDAFERADRHMTRFNAGFVTLVFEGGADFAALDFAVLVISVSGVDFQRAEGALQIAHF